MARTVNVSGQWFLEFDAKSSGLMNVKTKC